MKQRLEKLTENQLTARIHADALRLQVKQVCCDAGVPPVWLPNYYCFAMEIDKLERLEVSGESAALEADTIASKWLCRGLSQKVLEAIRTGVFNIPLTTP